MIKLYLDENVPEAISVELRLRGYDIKTVRDAEKARIERKKSDFIPWEKVKRNVSVF